MNTQNRYVLRYARFTDISSIVSLVNAEALRSAATVSSSPEPNISWQNQWNAQHAYYPWLVAEPHTSDDPHTSDLASVKIDRFIWSPNATSKHPPIGFAKAAPYNSRDGFDWSVTLSIYLNPNDQGQGLSTALYQNLFKILAWQGYRRSYARISLPNPASVALHQRFGLNQVGTLPCFAWKFDQWFDMAIFSGSIACPFHSKQVDHQSAPTSIISLSDLPINLKFNI